jgi:hypothetical protein
VRHVAEFLSRDVRLLAYMKVCKPVDEQAESFVARPRLVAVGSRHTIPCQHSGCEAVCPGTFLLVPMSLELDPATLRGAGADPNARAEASPASRTGVPVTFHRLPSGQTSGSVPLASGPFVRSQAATIAALRETAAPPRPTREEGKGRGFFGAGK